MVEEEPVRSHTVRGQLEHRALVGVPDVDRSGLRRVQQGQQPAHLVVDVAQAPGLGAVPVDREGPAGEGLHDEVGDDASVTGRQPRAVGVEDPDDRHVGAVGPVLGHGQGLGEPLGLVVDAARAHRVDVAAVVLRLGVDQGFAVDLAGGGEQEAGPVLPGQHQQAAGPLAAHGQGLQRAGEVGGRGGRARQMADRVHRDVDGDLGAHVGPDHGEGGVSGQVGHVLLAPGRQIVHADHPVAPGHQVLAQMGTEEAGAAGHHHGAHGRPSPTYPKPIRRSAAGSSRLRASTRRGVAITSRSFSKSMRRNSSHSVRTTTADDPSAAW